LTPSLLGSPDTEAVRVTGAPPAEMVAKLPVTLTAKGVDVEKPVEEPPPEHP